MTVVIDVGAARYGGDYSMERLVEQFEPTHLYAIDPNPALEPPATEQTEIVLLNVAAWIHDGEIPYRDDGLNSWVTFDQRAPSVPCIDLAAFVRKVAAEHDDRIVLKLDCEGSEYNLLPHLINEGADELLDLCIVEWHQMLHGESVQQKIAEQIHCELQEWPY
jgi:FkbM family methyltransferase